MITTLISLPYELTRRPLVLAGEAVTGRLHEDSLPRVCFDKAVGTADQVAGLLLRNGAIAQRGANRLQRSAVLAEAASLEDKAKAKRKQARRAEAAGHTKADRQHRAAEETLTEGLEEAEVVEAQAKRDARSAASKAASTRKAAADREAAAKKAAADQRRARTEQAASAKEKVAQRQAKAELDEARDDQKAAADARQDAERLEELTEAKKAERRSS